MTTANNSTDIRNHTDAQEEASLHRGTFAHNDNQSADEPSSLQMNPWLYRSLLAGSSLAVISAVVYYEVTRYHAQSLYFTLQAQGKISTEMVTTPPLAIGPYAQRTDYAHIPERVAAVKNKGWSVSDQNPHPVNTTLGVQLYPAYKKKTQHGLLIQDGFNHPFYSQSYPKNVIGPDIRIADIITKTLCFLEDRQLCETPLSEKENPAINGPRIGNAVLQKLHIMPGHSGASPLIVQNVKFDNSPKGATIDPVTGKSSVVEKFRQFATASRDIYTPEMGSEGSFLLTTNTQTARSRIMRDYLNGAPFPATAAGEHHGFADALKAWFGSDIAESNRLLSQVSVNSSDTELAQAARAYSEIFLLELSLKMGSYYMLKPEGFAQLLQRKQLLTPLLRQAGVIPFDRYADAINAVQFDFRDLRQTSAKKPAKTKKPRNKAADALRVEVARVLDYPHGMHELDKADLTVTTTLNQRADQEASKILHSLYDPEVAKAAGIIGKKRADAKLLEDIVYSAVLYRAGKDFNDKILQVDTNPGWLDVSQGTKLQLGSSTKPLFLEAVLRGCIYEAHQKYKNATPAELAGELAKKRGPFTKFVLTHLSAANTDKSVTGTLNAFMQTKYSASPYQSFFTDGGLQTYKNYRPEENGLRPTLQQALANSTNLPFIHLVANLVKEIQIENMKAEDAIYTDMDHPKRSTYLTRNVHNEGKKHLARYWNRFKGKSPDEIAAMMATGPRKKGLTGKRTPASLAIIYRKIFPDASQTEFETFIRAHANKVSDKTDFTALYEQYSPRRFSVDRRKDYLSLMDQGYVARLNELSLVVAAYQSQSPANKLIAEKQRALSEPVHSEARREELIADIESLKLKRWDRNAWNDMISQTEAERLAAAEWLINPRKMKPGIIRAQKKAIGIEMEREAFSNYIHPLMTEMGYAFSSENFSLGAVLGSISNTQAGLSEFAGNIVNGGLNKPVRTITQMEYAVGIPTFNRVMTPPVKPARQVTPPEVARVMQESLRHVAEYGTLRSIRYALEESPNAGRFIITGKTGTGRNVVYNQGRGGSKTVAESKSLTSTIMITIIDTKTNEKYFGSVLAYVEGQKSAKHHFSSELAKAVFINLAPVIKKLMESQAPSITPLFVQSSEPILIKSKGVPPLPSPSPLRKTYTGPMAQGPRVNAFDTKIDLTSNFTMSLIVDETMPDIWLSAGKHVARQLPANGPFLLTIK